MGHNGAGKTTTIEMISGHLIPTKGNIYVYDKEITGNANLAKGIIGVCA